MYFKCSQCQLFIICEDFVTKTLVDVVMDRHGQYLKSLLLGKVETPRTMALMKNDCSLTSKII